jgi:hypothetical protein
MTIQVVPDSLAKCYAVRSDCERQVKNFSGTIYQGCKTARDAEVAFVLGWAMGLIDLTVASVPRGFARLISMPLEELVDMLDHVHNETCQRWYVVYKGRHPGVYPLWYDICLLISCSIADD